jgi:hypothetical protein
VSEPTILGEDNVGEYWETAPEKGLSDMPEIEYGYKWIFIKGHENGYRTWRFVKAGNP